MTLSMWRLIYHGKKRSWDSYPFDFLVLFFTITVSLPLQIKLHIKREGNFIHVAYRLAKTRPQTDESVLPLVHVLHRCPRLRLQSHRFTAKALE